MTGGVERDTVGSDALERVQDTACLELGRDGNALITESHKDSPDRSITSQYVSSMPGFKHDNFPTHKQLLGGMGVGGQDHTVTDDLRLSRERKDKGCGNHQLHLRLMLYIVRTSGQTPAQLPGTRIGKPNWA